MRCCGEVVMDVVGAYSPHRQSYRGIDLIGSRTGITRGVGVKAIGLWLRLAVGLQASHEGAECFHGNRSSSAAEIVTALPTAPRS